MMRVAFLHTGAVVIPVIAAAMQAEIPDVTIVNYLDDQIVRDLGDHERRASVADRLVNLTRAARDAGADLVMLTCSSISAYAGPTADRVGIPVLRIDEAMADQAVAQGDRIAVVATLPTTLSPTIALLRERASLAGVEVHILEELVDGAFAAVSAGDRPQHDRLVAATISRLAADVDVVVLAQASMASAADQVDAAVPVLTSIRPGIARLAEVLAASHPTAEEGIR